MYRVRLFLKESSLSNILILGGRIFHSFGPMTAKEQSYADLAERDAELGRYGKYVGL